jgi:hypothetical protein
MDEGYEPRSLVENHKHLLEGVAILWFVSKIIIYYLR